jgi:hypothetical protein
LITKYKPNGDEVWIRRYNGVGNLYDIPSSMKVDNMNNVYITGYSYIDGYSKRDFLTIKYDSNGVQEWVRAYNGTGSGE